MVLRSVDTYTWRFLCAVRGGVAPHTASSSAMVDTIRFARHNSSASTTRCLCDPIYKCWPASCASNGPRIPNFNGDSNMSAGGNLRRALDAFHPVPRRGTPTLVAGDPHDGDAGPTCPAAEVFG